MFNRRKYHFMSISVYLVTLIMCSMLTSCYCEERSHRVKRKLIFNKSTKFFVRINGKDNVIKWNTIVAHGWGFRCNFDLPESIPKRYKFFKRDVHDEIDSIPTSWGREGYACIIKYICEMTARVRSSQQCGMLCEIGNIISNSKGTDVDFFQSLTSKCEEYRDKCPYPLEFMTPTSDD